MNVSNRKCVCTLARRSLRASRTRNLIAVLAIALTTVLFTSLFTIALSINDGFQQNNFRQVGGYSHGGFKYLTEAQYEALKDDPLIGQAGLRRFVGMPTQDPFNKAHVEVSYADANDAHWMYCDPAEGRLPQEGTDEAATDTHVLELLGVEPELAMIVTSTASSPFANTLDNSSNNAFIDLSHPPWKNIFDIVSAHPPSVPSPSPGNGPGNP